MHSKKSKVSGKKMVLMGAVEEHSPTQTDAIREKLLEEGPAKLKRELE